MPKTTKTVAKEINIMIKKSKAPLAMSVLNVVFLFCLAGYFFFNPIFGPWILMSVAAADALILLAFSILAYIKEGGWAIALIVLSVLLLPFNILTLVAGIKIHSAEKERAELAKDHPIPMAKDLKLQPLPEDEGWSDEVAYFRPVHDEDIFKYFGYAQEFTAVAKFFERKRVFLPLYLDNESKKERTFECMFVTEYGEKVGDRTYVMYFIIENGKRDYDSILHFARIGRSEDGKTFLQVVSELDLIERLQDDIDTLYGEQIKKEIERREKEAAQREKNKKGMLSDLGEVFGTLFMSDSAISTAVHRYRGESEFEYSCTYTNSMGYTQTVYTNDKVKFYRANGEYVGYSEDGGRTIIEE